MLKRCLLIGLTVSMSSCGDDESTNDTKVDAGSQVAGDGGVSITPGKVLNVGAACASASDCEGAPGKTRCLADEPFPLAGGGITYHGGYCSAECVDSKECTGEDGSAGECPFGSMLSMAGALPGIGSLLNGLSVCMKPCSTAADCRDDHYTCDTVASLLPTNSQIPAGLLTSFLPSTRYCLSTDIVVPDAGLGGLIPGSDAGVAGDASTDSAVSDGGDEDAASSQDASGEDDAA